jgi:hypothetical protein
MLDSIMAMLDSIMAMLDSIMAMLDSIMDMQRNWIGRSKVRWQHLCQPGVYKACACHASCTATCRQQCNRADTVRVVLWT